MSLWQNTVVQREGMLQKVSQEDVPRMFSNASWEADVLGTCFSFLAVLIKLKKKLAKIKGQLTKHGILRIISFTTPVAYFSAVCSLLWFMKKPTTKQPCRTMLHTWKPCLNFVGTEEDNPCPAVPFLLSVSLEGTLHASSSDLFIHLTVHIETCCSQACFKASKAFPASSGL